MYLATDPATGERVYAEPRGRAICPTCNAPVIAKCGRLISWHWAHENTEDCDPWSEMSPWHLGWQELFPKEWREVVVENDGIKRRADVRLPDGRVIEFQRSSLSTEAIEDREIHYGENRMLWVFDAFEAFDEERLRMYRPAEARTGARAHRYRSFRWKHPRRSIAECLAPVFLDVGDGWLFEVKAIYTDGKFTGWGYAVTYREFLSRFLVQQPIRKDAA